MFFFFITLLSLLGRWLVGDRSPTCRRLVASSLKELQNLVATPLRSLWILVAERSQSGCSVCLTEALLFEALLFYAVSATMAI